LRKALNAFFEVLAQYTIEDIVDKRDVRALLGIDILEQRLANAS